MTSKSETRRREVNRSANEIIVTRVEQDDGRMQIAAGSLVEVDPNQTDLTGPKRHESVTRRHDLNLLSGRNLRGDLRWNGNLAGRRKFAREVSGLHFSSLAPSV